MRTAKAQISLRIRAVWSGPLLSANRLIVYYKMYEWRAKAWIILCACTGWSESAHFAHVRRHFFARGCPYDIRGIFSSWSLFLSKNLANNEPYQTMWRNILTLSQVSGAGQQVVIYNVKRKINKIRKLKVNISSGIWEHILKVKAFFFFFFFVQTAVTMCLSSKTQSTRPAGHDSPTLRETVVIVYSLMLCNNLPYHGNK